MISLHRSLDGRLFTLTLNRVERKNALNDEAYSTLSRLLDEASGDPSVGAVCLTGAGDYFTSGQDFGEVGGREEGARSIDCPVGRFMLSLLRCTKPVIAAVNGPAVGVGVTLLAHCDVWKSNPPNPYPNLAPNP
jgi:enoyl-CoA hydratase/carnithine racemase